MDNNKQALKLARNLIRIGLVNSINPNKGSVKVLFPDKDNTVSNDLPMMNNEYNMPNIGEQVLCLFLGNGLEQGFCLGSFYSELSGPVIGDENIYRKHFDDETYIEYNKSNKIFQIKATTPITIKGDFKIEGDLDVSGNISGSNIGS